MRADLQRRRSVSCARATPPTPRSPPSQHRLSPDELLLPLRFLMRASMVGYRETDAALYRTVTVTPPALRIDSMP